MATSVMTSLSLKPSPFTSEKTAVRGLPSLAKTSSFKVQASGVKKIKTDKPYGIGGGMDLRDGKDASGRKPKGKGVYQFVDKYGANVDGYRLYCAVMEYLKREFALMTATVQSTPRRNGPQAATNTLAHITFDFSRGLTSKGKHVRRYHWFVDLGCDPGWPSGRGCSTCLQYQCFGTVDTPPLSCVLSLSSTL
ncbi:hypothetical protein RJ639_000828 [Escallonia herrerae]|uniref:Photosystem II 10 kDa polypeptide, chloroplastic n=1 Tax=Escallonia herrerae TaxID=1293975 RepID=A0AA88X9K6_9ASTE|nr:hypothetical protein RJ639_000828 [Escallonia herrerae]